METFYQFNWKETAIDPVGTYFSETDLFADGGNTAYSTNPALGSAAFRNTYANLSALGVGGLQEMCIRDRLEAEVRRQGEAIGQGDALNDVVLHPGKSTRMIEFELYIDGQFVCSQKADGLIVATPTGSTAYALSAGGPIMHPKLDAIVVVPMYPHTLSSRPIVVDGNSELKVVVSPDMTIYPQVSCDGQNHFTCAPGDTLHVAKKAQKLRLIHPLDHNYYEVCRTCLLYTSRCV